MNELFEVFASAFQPESKKSLSECLLLSVPKVGDEIVENIKSKFDHGKYEINNDFELTMTDPMTLNCQWSVSYDYQPISRPVDEWESKHGQEAVVVIVRRERQ